MMHIPLVCDLDTFTYALSETHYEMALRDEPFIVPVVRAAPVIAPYVTQSAAVIEPEESMLLTFRQ